ncbi:MAG: hypothetical protein JXR83_01140, partial [Deltaproteobacteria bacterium]|nr:hypothetical protein [Deltaproteobacteria bacterium]
ISSSATADAADSSAAGQADAGATVSGSIDAALAVVTADNSAAVDQSPRRDYLAVQQKRKFNDLEKDLQKKMESRSILSQDSAALDREISRAQSLRQQRKWREANEALHRAISQAETIEIDRAFVKAKLERFNKLSSNIKDGAAIRRFEPLLTAYDEAMRQGRYASANQALTKAIQLASRQ